MTHFYLGTHRPHWLRLYDLPLFVSHRTLKTYKTLPRALHAWALDSGGFTELSSYGGWTVTPRDYLAAVRRYRDEIGRLDWASPQDWMCEPFITAKTGKTVAEHQRLTVENFLELRSLAADLPIIPVLQGWLPDDYLRHADAYAAAGVDLAAEVRVGVGSVCRRQDTGTAREIFTRLNASGLSLHGFGVKLAGLRVYADQLASADSMAWSFRGRRAATEPGRTCDKKACNNCAHFALEWREKALAAQAAS